MNIKNSCIKLLIKQWVIESFFDYYIYLTEYIFLDGNTADHSRDAETLIGIQTTLEKYEHPILKMN